MAGNKAGKMSQRLDEQAWLAVLARFDGAAMTLEEFCRREGLTRSCFARWRTRLRPDLKRTPALTVSRSAALAPTPSFVDLGVLGTATSTTEPAGLDLRIELGGGLSLHLVRR